MLSEGGQETEAAEKGKEKEEGRNQEGGRRKGGERREEEEGREEDGQLDLRAVLREMDFENSVFSKEERRARSHKRLIQAEKKYFARRIRARRIFEDREATGQPV